VIVGGDGENSVVVSEGSNAYVRAEQLDALHIREGDVVSLQYELPAEVVARVAEAASFAGATVLVNPSPWRADDAGILPSCFMHPGQHAGSGSDRRVSSTGQAMCHSVQRGRPVGRNRSTGSTDHSCIHHGCG